MSRPSRPSLRRRPRCHLCGTTAGRPGPAEEPGAALHEAAVDGVPLTWTTAVESGRSRVFCAACSRTHLRAIEGKLDSEWW